MRATSAPRPPLSPSAPLAPTCLGFVPNHNQDLCRDKIRFHNHSSTKSFSLVVWQGSLSEGLAMPPISGESSMDKAERLRKAANALREKARYARVTAILKNKPSVCAKVEELLIQEGELELELATSPR